MDITTWSAAAATLAGVLAMAATSFVSYLSSKKSKESDEKFYIELKVSDDKTTSELKEEDTNFGTLWGSTQDRLRSYHKIATDQARRSFVSSQIATTAGFILVIVMGIIASQAKDPISAISTGAVGVVGGGLSAYIGATFMKSQAEASAQLQQFFLQPVEFSRLLGAERLIENLEPEHKAEAIKMIVTSMMQQQPSHTSNKD